MRAEPAADPSFPLELFVETQGEGPPVVLGHGFGGSGRNFRPQARALRDTHRVVLFDARGHARSPAPRDPTAYRPECFVADLARLVDDHAPSSPAVVGGLSMGAGVALRYALAHPERVRALVLMAPPPARDEASRGNRWVLDLADAIEAKGLEAAGEEYVWGPSSGLDPAAAGWVKQGFLEHAPHALVHTARGLLAVQPSVGATAEALARFEPPVLVVVGDRDRLSLRVAHELADALPAARLEVVADAGHVVNLLAPKAVNAGLVDFLAGLDEGA